VLGPAANDPATGIDDRSLVLLFRTEGGSLLWAGRLDARGQAELLRAYPALHADVLVLAMDAPPDPAWLESLGVRYCLRLPPREKFLNSTQGRSTDGAPWQLWPLEKTGAVTVRFTNIGPRRTAGVFLQPWAALPPQQ
jgi:hypothetical protein